MYFLNGDRIYIKAENSSQSLDAQLKSCLGQLKQINSGKQVFKLNFFVDTSSVEAYRDLQQKVTRWVDEHFTTPVITAVIAQPPLSGKLIAEAFYYDPAQWEASVIEEKSGSAIQVKRDATSFLIGHVQVDTMHPFRESIRSSFDAFGNLLKRAGFPVNAVVRQWNYLENITGLEGEKQHYQEFNDERSAFYADHFKDTGYPAATGIGMNRGGVIIEFVALRSDAAQSIPLDNPEQVAAHDYSEKVLVGGKPEKKTTPKFERARYLDLFGKKLIFISGTASIRGEEIVGNGDPAYQTVVTIENIQRLYSSEVLNRIPGDNLKPKYGHARVYIKNRKDYTVIRKTVETYFGELPVVYIQADICRDDLLVEIEGKVILE